MSNEDFNEFQKDFELSSAMGQFKKIRDALVAGGFTVDESLKVIALLLLLGNQNSK